MPSLSFPKGKSVKCNMFQLKRNASQVLVDFSPSIPKTLVILREFSNESNSIGNVEQ